MTTALVPSIDHPTRHPFTQVSAVLGALAGRLGWRLWWPVVPWLAAAGIARTQALSAVLAPGETGPIMTGPAGVLLVGGVVAIPLLWVWGARYALSLGHHRGVVFGVTAATSLLLQGVLHAASLSAALVELRVVGADGARVFALETGNTFGTEDTLWNGSWLFGLYYVLPVFALMVTASAAIVRWGARGALTLLAIPVVLVGVLALMSLGGGAWPVTATLYAALLVGSIGAAWWIFRDARV